jgi:hypothetical protein
MIMMWLLVDITLLGETNPLDESLSKTAEETIFGKRR